MTVRIHTTLPGVSQEQFDAMHKLITAGEPPKGLLFHSSAPVEGGWQVIDFWESRQDYDAAMVGVQQGMAAAGVRLRDPRAFRSSPSTRRFSLDWIGSRPTRHHALIRPALRPDGWRQ